MNRRIPLVIDTDASGEIDGPFAIAYALSCPGTFDVQALLAAPFLTEKSSSRADGMEKSLRQIERIRALLGSSAPAFPGSVAYLPGGGRPVESAACDALIRLAKAVPYGEKLHVAAIAALTNVASALIKAPEIAEKLRICWLGAHAVQMPSQDGFNHRQDRVAVRALFDSGAEILWFPRAGVVSHLSLTVWEAERWLTSRNALCDELIRMMRGCGANGPGQSRVIWGIAPVAYLRDPLCAGIAQVPAPVFAGSRIELSDGCHKVAYVRQIDRDRVFFDFFRAVSGGALQSFRKEESR
jgi:inosine-uridine nucleoside N-ribohydrolase